MPSFLRRFSISAICIFASQSSASSFLSREITSEEELTPELELTILTEIEGTLDSSGKDARMRLRRIEDAMRSTFKALPKNAKGKLAHAAARYALHSYFVQRHAWYVRGVADLGENSANSSVTGVLQDRVDDFIQGAFERRLGAQGLDLHELAALAATYENLVHQEAVKRLSETYRLLELSPEVDELNIADVDSVLDSYMMGYILALNYTALKPAQLRKVQEKIPKAYPTWNKTREFLRDVRSRHGFQQSFFNRGDVESVLEEVGDQYGRWQNSECQRLKDQLLELEDKSIGTNGSGRVRLSDFYGSALHDGNWQFSESIDYLRTLGALDTNDPAIPRVIIPNYINSPSNCLASSKFYSVCCINECEAIIDRVEHHFLEPTATPASIAAFVSTLPSKTVQANRELPPLLLSRLEEIADRHDGRVPLHGRLFTQWLHHAYPRECPYPHIAGQARPLTAKEYWRKNEVMPVVSRDQMPEVWEEISSGDADRAHTGNTECTAWSHDEELYVGSDHTRQQPSVAKGIMQWIRPAVYLAAASAAVIGLRRRLAVSGGSVAKAACTAKAGKDLFV